ncbi:MAG: hypothetical protein P8Y73_05875 [Desulfuromonadales bacterium]|jgi:hypothetical protein
MKVSKRTTVVALLCLVSLFLGAGELFAQQQENKDRDLEAKRIEFQDFAKSKVQQLNRNHRFARSRMQIIPQDDGTYLARYHQIDDENMKMKVRRSESGSAPFVAVLSYREQVFEARAPTREKCQKSPFNLVRIIPNRHIFCYRKGAWN